MESLVSIILPTYNVERYIDKCLDSIINQTYTNIEIIIVIDGSTDTSLDIAKKYQEKDFRVRIFKQENKGSGPARNLGLEHASGEYCIFVDPDDWIDRDMVEQLMFYQKINDYDLVTTNWKVWDKQGLKIKSDVFTNKVYKSENTKDTRNLYLKLFGLNFLSAPSTKLYKTSIIKENNVEFPSLRRSQDIVFNYRYYGCIQSVYAKDISYYNYRFDNSANFNKINKDYFKTIELIYSQIMKCCKKWEIVFNGGEQDEGYILTCNYLLQTVLLPLQANVSKNESIKEIIDSELMQEIVKNSKPTNFYKKLIKYNFINKNYTVLKNLLKIRVFTKNVYLDIEERLNNKEIMNDVIYKIGKGIR